MAFAVRVLADSVSPTGDRLITILGTYPRKIHSELLTHRLFSRNSASSRAIPVGKMLSMIEEDPVIPIWWGKNQGGMQAWEEVEDKAGAEQWWRDGLKMMVAHARRGVELNLHKQIVNRTVESGMWITVVLSATTWSNFQGLRVHKDAEPHFQRFSGMAMESIAKSSPRHLKEGEWHLPFIYDEDMEAASKISLDQLVGMGTSVSDILVKVSVGRCGRVSYLTHEGKRDLIEDVKLHDRLVVQEPLHASPGEHVAMALDYPSWFRKKFAELSMYNTVALNNIRMENRDQLARGAEMTVDNMAVEAALAQVQSGNFRGWKQYRKMKMNEHIGERMP